MDTLLTLAFDNISSKNTDKIRKGLKQIEGLLAQICLDRTHSQSQSHSQPHSSSDSASQAQSSPIKSLAALHLDPAYFEFHRLQQSFEYNLASRLVDTLDRLLGLHKSPQVDALLLSTLTVLHGTLLLHPPSRHLFSRETSMLALLDLLDPAAPAAVLEAAVLTLVSALLGAPRCARAFEAADGLRTVASLFRSSQCPTNVRMKIVEFLYFYLMPEPSENVARPSSADAMARAFGGGGYGTAATSVSVATTTATPTPTAGEGEMSALILPMPTPTPGKGYSQGGPSFVIAKDDTLTRSTEDKQRLLGKYLSNVADLVQDLRESGSLPDILDGGGMSVSVF